MCTNLNVNMMCLFIMISTIFSFELETNVDDCSKIEVGSAVYKNNREIGIVSSKDIDCNMILTIFDNFDNAVEQSSIFTTTTNFGKTYVILDVSKTQENIFKISIQTDLNNIHQKINYLEDDLYRLLGEQRDSLKDLNERFSNFMHTQSLSNSHDRDAILYWNKYFTEKNLLYISDEMEYLSNDMNEQDSLNREDIYDLDEQQTAFQQVANRKFKKIDRKSEANNQLILDLETLVNRLIIENELKRPTKEKTKGQNKSQNFENTDIEGFGDWGVPPPPSTNNNRPDFVMYDQAPIPKKSLMSLVTYPDICKQAGIEGRVTIRVWVDDKGKVDLNSIEVVESIPCMDNACIQAIKKSRWKPARMGRKKVGAPFNIPFIFKLEADN